jgi:hypothetical protein
MKKNSFLLLTVILFAGINGFSQDTLKLFSRHHPPRENVEKKREHPREHSSDEIRTICGNHHSNGFFIGFHSDYSQIFDYDALSVGGNLAWVANHGLAIGLAGNGFFTEPQPFPGYSTKEYNYTGGYGGLLIEPILFPRFPVHLSFPVILGAGGVARGIYYDLNYPYEYSDGYVENADAFLIAEPGVELEINAARWIRLSVGLSYRFTQGIDSKYFSDNPLDGMTTGFSLKFGKF